MNTSNRRSKRLADKSIMNTVFNTTNNTEVESVKYISQTDVDLLNSTSIIIQRLLYLFDTAHNQPVTTLTMIAII